MTRFDQPAAVGEPNCLTHLMLGEARAGRPDETQWSIAIARDEADAGSACALTRTDR